jgi:hypothetical protein
MVYTFARISAALGMKDEDVFTQHRLPQERRHPGAGRDAVTLDEVEKIGI